MKNHIRQTVLIVLTAVLLVAGAAVTMIVGYALDYRTVRIDYTFQDGSSAYDPYIAVIKMNEPVNIDVTNPIIQGYKAVVYDEDGNKTPEPFTHVQVESLTENMTLTVYYVPDTVPYKV